MTDEKETSINSLYHQRKRRNRAPTAMKKRLFARKQQLKGATNRDKWIRNSLATGVLGIVFVVLYLQLPVHTPISVNDGSMLLYANIELHTMENERTTFNATKKVTYADILQETENIKMAYSQIAKVLSAENGLSLVNCKNEMIKITPSVLDTVALLNAYEAGNSTSEKQFLLIDFSQSGNIVAIQAASTEAHLNSCFALAD